MKRFIHVMLLCFMAEFAMAQAGHSVRGVVIDSAGAKLAGTTVVLRTSVNDSLITSTDGMGTFGFSSVRPGPFTLSVHFIGYKTFMRRFKSVTEIKPLILAPIVLGNGAIMLKGVTVLDAAAIKLKEDTVEYNAAAYKVRENAPVEDALRKLPGVDVDKDGNVTAQGKSVSRVRVNGKDYFGGDLQTATKNLPADMVQSYQIIDDYGDQANLTGIKSGEPEKILNINIKPSKNFGHFGQITAGDGKDDIPEKAGTKDGNRYIAGVTAFKFSGDQQLSLLANINNTNSNLFSFGSPPGGGRGGGGGGRGGPGGPGGGNASASGITTARSVGFNYRDSWGKKITAYGSFSFADNTVNTLSSTLQNNISLRNSSLNQSASDQTSEKKNVRFNYNIEYKPDTLNYLKIIPSFSYAGLGTNLTGSNNLSVNEKLISSYLLNTSISSTSPSLGLNLLYNHRFKTRGRNFSINGGAGTYHSFEFQNPVYSYLTGKAGVPLNQLIHTNSKTDSIGTTLSYMEPLSKTSFLEFNYGYHTAHTTAGKETDTLTSAGESNLYPLLSNNYAYTFTTNRVGLNYRVIQKKFNYTLGLSGEPTALDGYSLTTGLRTHISTFNLAPTARYIYNFSRNQSLSLNYNAGSVQPGYSFLQPVTDFSNALYPVRGNPDLRPEFNSNLSLRYNKFDYTSGNVFFSNLSFVQTGDKIVANTVYYPRKYLPDPKLAGTMLTQYQNASGYYSGSAFYLFAKPWEKRKYTLMFNGNINYNNNISYITNIDSASYFKDTQKNIAKNLVFTQGVRFRVSITDIVDAEISSSYSLNHSDNSIPQANVNSNFRTLNLGLNGKNYLFTDWTFSYDFTRTIYEGYKGAVNPNVLNMYIERRFLKNNIATLRCSAFDLFNQNTGYTSTQTGNSIIQTNANRLGRYYLLTFSLKLQKFAGKRPEGGPGGPGGMRPGGGPGGPGGFGGGPGHD